MTYFMKEHYLILVMMLMGVGCFRVPHLMGHLLHRSPTTSYSSPSPYSWETITVNQTLDHFSFGEVGKTATFTQRLLVNETFWFPGGPIFFYTGNEGDIEMFARNTGFMFDIAPKFNACIVFAEHRYYGQSLPFGNASFASPDKTKYLTVEQALADYAHNLIWLKSSFLKVPETPVIAFGGSYGGMLAAWFRLKYPSMVDGAIAASAPLWMFPGMMKDCTSPYQVITGVFRNQGNDCNTKVSASWKKINSLAISGQGRKKLQVLFKTCKPFQTVSDVSKLLSWLDSMYFDMAMVNYPYPTSFLADLPAWPVSRFCGAAAKQSDTLTAIAAGSQIYFNYTGTSKCLDLDSDPAGGLGMTAWDVQACLQMILPICSDPAKDMFPKEPFDLKSYVQYCENQWKSVAQPYWLKYTFGGIYGFNFKSASQIFFSDGNLDPWSAGGVQQVDGEVCGYDCPKFLIKDGAHHLDLRGSNENDPSSVIEARYTEIEAISRWISPLARQRKVDF